MSLMENANKLISNRKLTTIMVTHNMREAVSYGNRLLMMKEGKIIRDLDEIEKSTSDANNLINWLYEA
jgi:putative ABC transport system ATP-binding protein